jgi:hypothetical protein
MNLKNGDILICRADRLIPRIIKLVTKSKWNHTAIYAEVWDTPGVIEAQMDGINWKPWDAWVEKYNYDFIVYRKDQIHNRKNILRRAFTKCGHTGYDFVAFILRHPWQLITGKWKSRGDNKEDDRMICSEFSGWVYNMPDWYKMTPDMQKKHLDDNIMFTKITS